jgi:hypothetical protein
VVLVGLFQQIPRFIDATRRQVEILKTALDESGIGVLGEELIQRILREGIGAD